MPKLSGRKALAALLAFLILAEATARWGLIRDGCYGYRPLPPFGAMPHPRQRAWLEERLRRGPSSAGALGQFDRELGWTWVRPGVDEPGLDRDTRGPGHYEDPKPDGILRVACFGDSYTFGMEVADDEAWPRAMEAARPGLEAPNLGVGGYGTDQALLRFRRSASTLHADVVCIGLMLENIGRNVNRYRPLWYPADPGCYAKPRFVLEDGELRLVPLPFATQDELVDAVADGSVLQRIASHERWLDVPRMGILRYSGLARLAGAWFAYRARDVRGLWLDSTGEACTVTLALLEAFHREALRSGARAAPVVIFPRIKDLQGFVEGGDRYWSGLRRELERRGVPSIDLADALAEWKGPLEAASGADSLYRSGGHLGAAGNRIVARTVLGWIEAQLGSK
jgi:hypothetical protein